METKLQVERAQAQRICAENSEKQKKIKQMKKLIVFALGIIVLCRMHPLYLIPLLILGTVVYA